MKTTSAVARIGLLTLALAVLALAANCKRPATTPAQPAAPELAVPKLDDGQVTVSELLQGKKAVLLYFWQEDG